ncbi:MAG: hypothetical protein P8K08_01355 [Fuerstiella sp.]|nr:hypothetical protein [Fuerstiella sp.]
MNDQAVVISLERATERFAHGATLLPQLPRAGEVLLAVDRNAMSPDEVSQMIRPGQ